MDVEDDGASPDGPDDHLESRAPEEGDLATLCRALNEAGAQYVIVGGFAIIQAGLPRMTGDIDLLIATDDVNEAKVFQAMEVLPDQAVRFLDPGDVSRYTVVRVADEVTVDLMKSACGIEYAEAAKHVIIREVQGVPIPFASPQLLWRMKAPTRREKDQGDLVFLREYFRQRGEEPPALS